MDDGGSPARDYEGKTTKTILHMGTFSRLKFLLL